MCRAVPMLGGMYSPPPCLRCSSAVAFSTTEGAEPGTWTHSGACHGETVQVTTSHALLDIFTTWRLLRGLDSDTATSESREIGGAGDAV